MEVIEIEEPDGSDVAVDHENGARYIPSGSSEVRIIDLLQNVNIVNNQAPH